MNNPQAEEDDVGRLVEVLSSQKVGENKKYDAGYQIDDHVRNSCRYRQSAAATSMPPVRNGLEELWDEVDYGQKEAEDYETKMDPETNIIVPCVSDWTSNPVGIIGEEEVGNAVARAEASVARLRARGGGGRCVGHS